MNHYCQSVSTKGGSFFKISAVFEDDSLDLTIFENQTAWNINVPKDDLIKQLSNRNTNFNEYYNNLKKYVECPPKHVEFDFKAGVFSISLLLDNKMKMLYFDSVLNEVQFSDSIFSVVDTLYSKKAEYFNELNDVKIQFACLQESHVTLEKKLNEFLDRKKHDEQNLYNNFIVILNEKKRQIQHLNDLLVAFRQGRPTINSSVQVKRKMNGQGVLKNIRKTVSAPKAFSGSESDSNSHDTEDSDSGSPSAPKINNNVSKESKNPSPVPSTSKIPDDMPSNSPTEQFTFAKRIRTENKLKLNTIWPKKETEKQQDQEKAFLGNVSSIKNKKLPTVNFSTQDLLDNL